MVEKMKQAPLTHNDSTSLRDVSWWVVGIWLTYERVPTSSKLQGAEVIDATTPVCTPRCIALCERQVSASWARWQGAPPAPQPVPALSLGRLMSPNLEGAISRAVGCAIVSGGTGVAGAPYPKSTTERRCIIPATRIVAP